MADQQIPETKNSDAPGDQDQAAQQAPAEVDGRVLGRVVTLRDRTDLPCLSPGG